MITSAPFIIRPIEQEDNSAIAKIIRDVLIEFGVPKIGTAYEDKTLDCMFETYQQEKHQYYIVEHLGNVVGGGGIAPLQGTDDSICELQKMYFSPIARGKGSGSEMIKKCLSNAKDLGFEKCYLETMPYMETARLLYKKNGFTPLEKPLGNTGHYSCNVWMIKNL